MYFSFFSVYALCKLCKVEGDFSEIARQGSGSACRSIYGGFVQWHMGNSEFGHDSIASVVKEAEHWSDLRILILVVSLAIFKSRKAKEVTLGKRKLIVTLFLLME